MTDSSPTQSARHFPRITAHSTTDAARSAIDEGKVPKWLVGHTERNRHVLGPHRSVVEEWTRAGLKLPDLTAVRRYRIERVREQLRHHNIDGVVLHDPLNVRYATDTTNMPVWTMHNAVRYAWVPADGDVVLFEFSHGEFLSAHSEVIDEIRPATSFVPFYSGSRSAEIAGRFADEIIELLRRDQRTGDMRLGIDNIGLEGLRTLEARGATVLSAHQLMEEARLVKSGDEIDAMRCAIESCQRSISDMRSLFVPGVTELELWAELQKANFLRHGEWVETRLLASGARTNPWYQEASIKEVEAGELMAFDTDMVGAFGMCVEPAPVRGWRNLPRDNNRLSYPDVDEFNGYTVLAHGTGLCDEYPSLFTREQWDDRGFDGVVEVGNGFSIESFVGRRGSGEGVKLEDMIVVAESGPELLTDYLLDLA